jgi:NAD(P)-dependent dehydrogenase (short-subunit alcohol dehydrogenase family)
VTSKTIVLTGGSSGIGEAAAETLCKTGHNVIITGRSSYTADVAKRIGAEHFVVDFEHLSEVREFARQILERYPRIDVLVNNAGAMYGTRRITADGHEATFQVNHLAGFLLTRLLHARLAESHGVVINTASGAHRYGRIEWNDLESERAYNEARAYGTSKLMNILHAKEIGNRYAGVRAVSFHPGGVATRFARDAGKAIHWLYTSRVGRMFMISPKKGADTLLWLMSGKPGIDWTAGEYYYKRKPGRTTSHVTAENARRLWDVSDALV